MPIVVMGAGAGVLAEERQVVVPEGVVDLADLNGTLPSVRDLTVETVASAEPVRQQARKRRRAET